MLTKLTTSLAAAFVIAAASSAIAQEFDPNPANRYPAYAGPVMGGSYGAGPAGMVSAGNRDAGLPAQTRDRRAPTHRHYGGAASMRGGNN